MAFRINVTNDARVRAALRQLPAQGKRALTAHVKKLSRDLALVIREAGRTDSRQSARAATTVYGTSTGVTAGPHPLLFGSEFGANGRYGFYSAPQYTDSIGRQFRPHTGRGSYWFFKTVENNKPMVEHELQAAVDDVLAQWGGGR